jgi:hypothetical protein
MPKSRWLRSGFILWALAGMTLSGERYLFDNGGAAGFWYCVGTFVFLLAGLAFWLVAAAGAKKDFEPPARLQARYFFADFSWLAISLAALTASLYFVDRDYQFSRRLILLLDVLVAFVVCYETGAAIRKCWRGLKHYL